VKCNKGISTATKYTVRWPEFYHEEFDCSDTEGGPTVRTTYIAVIPASCVLSKEEEWINSLKNRTLTISGLISFYALVTGEDGKPVELGRGAMGITYKAFDVDLHCPVTLKVISARFLNDESARLRFLREARAAASVRHPNVASVFHLGKTGGSYFYAMEFVEGETLENLIKRSGRLEVSWHSKSRRKSPPVWQRYTSRSSFTGTSNQATSW
jgi:hypothetical protein